MPASLPQRPSLVGKRNGLAMLERRREREADIRPAVVVSALGREFLTVKDSANDSTYTVANPTGKTYAPESVVYLGSNTGHGPEFVIAGPPTGFGGSSVSPSIGYRTPLPSEPVAAADGIAFFADGSDVAATYYIAMTAGVLYGSAAELGSVADAIFVRADPRLYVGAYSLAYWNQSDTFSVFDPNVPDVYTYTPAADYHLYGFTVDGGYAYWLEGEKVQHGGVGTYSTYFRLRRASLDLSDAATLATFNFPNTFPEKGAGDNYSIVWGAPGVGWNVSIVRMASGLVVDVGFNDGAEVTGSVRVTTSYVGIDSIANTSDPMPTGDYVVETPYAVTDHPTYGSPVLGGAFPLVP